jgi:5-methyltetrahydropteroyltriglutamate--homocysteine methyltransferase
MIFILHAYLVKEKLKSLLRKVLLVSRAGQVWVNPDCGLKTRKWEEVKASLPDMVRAAQKPRAELAARA